MDFFTPAIEIIKLLLDPLSRQINYVRMFRKNLTELKGKRDTLVSKEKDVSKEIAAVESHSKEPTNVVQDWLKRVANVKKEISDIENKCEENKMCFKNCMPDYCSRLKVSKRSLELIHELEGLINERPSKDDVAHEALPATKDTFATTCMFGEQVIETYKKQIWEWLENENIGKIGVYGMGGVGKSTIMAHIHNDLRNDKHFDNVLWVTVSKEELNLKRLQIDIAKAIGLKFSDEHYMVMRSCELFNYFSRRKKFVLILDDLLKAFPLDIIGIPEPNKENGAKIVLTTRSSSVCFEMETQASIKVDVLPEVYAWDLFSSRVENDVLSKPEIVKVAKLVAKECKGLPLALKTVGGALRNANDVGVWKHALNELRGSTHDIRGMEDDLFKRLKFSYTRLSDDNVRACFLYCSLYPEGCEIDEKELIKLWMWEGLINEDEDIEKVMVKGYSILNELINACMLERVPYANDDDDKEVKMHDLIRDMAIGITRDSLCFMVKTGVGLKEQPKAEEFLENIERISLSRNNIASLIGQPKCPKLRTLFLNDNYQLSSISSSFFLYMHNVRVLDLSMTKIEALPESLSDLVNLHALLLERCHRLVVLPSLAKLKELRILNLCQTGIEELPPGMEGLIKLRYLDLSWTSHLKTIRVGILLQLSALEELSFRESSWKFDLIDEVSKIIINEISALKRLDKLSISFKDMRSFLSFHESHPWKSLHKFVSLIRPIEKREEDGFCYSGKVWMGIGDTNFCSVLHFDVPEIEIMQCWCSLVTPQVVIDSRAFRWCTISFCERTEYIFKGGEHFSLSTIETLSVKDMYNLKAISRGVMPSGALASLKVLKLDDCRALEHVFTACLLQNLKNLEEVYVRYCDAIVEVATLREGDHHGILQSLRILEIKCCSKLKNLFSSDLLESLTKLEEIKIHNCMNMEQMVVEEADGEEICEVKNITGNAISLPRLRKLELLDTWNLKCISKRMLICNSLQQVELRYCPDLSSLPLSIENPTATVNGCIEESREWWNALDWEDSNTKTILQPLVKFLDHSVIDRDGIIPLSVIKELPSEESLLRYYRINIEGETPINDISGLKKLDKMESFQTYIVSYHWSSLQKYIFRSGRIGKRHVLCHCGNVRMMTYNNNHGRGSLFVGAYLEIKQCWRNLKIPPVLLDLRVFKTCKIASCGCTEYILKGGENLSLSTIKTLRVMNMWNLKATFIGVIPSAALANLKVLKLINCVQMEDIIAAEKGEDQVALPSLSILSIYRCYRLKTLFSFDLLQRLQNIKEIEIHFCPIMEQMVVENPDGDDICEVKNINGNVISLPKLQVLKLESLENLKCICKRMLICNSLQKIELCDCPHLSSLPLSIERPTGRIDGFIKGSRDWWNTLAWEDPNTKTILQPLFEEECP